MLAQSCSIVALVVQSCSINHSVRGDNWGGVGNTGRQLKWRPCPHWAGWGLSSTQTLWAASLGFQTEGDRWGREPLCSTRGNDVPQSPFLWGSFHYFRSQHKMYRLWGSSEGWLLQKGWWGGIRTWCQGGWEQVLYQQETGMLCKRALDLA